MSPIKFFLSVTLLTTNLYAEERSIRPTYAGKQDKITTTSLKAELLQFRKLGKIVELRDRITTQKLAIIDLRYIYETTKTLGLKEVASKVKVLKSKTDIQVAKADLAYLIAERDKTIAEAMIQKYTILEQGNDDIDNRLEIAQETDKSYDAYIAMHEAEISKINARVPYYKKRMEIAQELTANGSGSVSTNELGLRIFEYKKSGEKIASIKYLIKSMKLAKKTLARSIERLAKNSN